MSAATDSTIVERVFNPKQHAMSSEVAKWLLSIRADDELQARFDELADKNTEGTISKDELEEYDDCLRISSILAVLQARAGETLSRSNGH